MNTILMDECYRARVNEQLERFPLREFRRAFVEQYAAHGVVFIQAYTYDSAPRRMWPDPDAGFMFRRKSDVDTAIWLVRRWGFSVIFCKGKKYRYPKYDVYIVQLPDKYLRNKISRGKIGDMRTALRSKKHLDAKEGNTSQGV